MYPDAWTRFAYGPLMLHGARGEPMKARWRSSLERAGFEIVEMGTAPLSPLLAGRQAMTAANLARNEWAETRRSPTRTCSRLPAWHSSRRDSPSRPGKSRVAPGCRRASCSSATRRRRTCSLPRWSCRRRTLGDLVAPPRESASRRRAGRGAPPAAGRRSARLFPGDVAGPAAADVAPRLPVRGVCPDPPRLPARRLRRDWSRSLRRSVARAVSGRLTRGRPR